MQKQYVRSLFDSIAYRYDLLNHLLSGGIDLYWRRRVIEVLRPSRPQRILDVATGTGDLAVAATRLDPASITGVDIAAEMLERGRGKVLRKGLDHAITLVQGDAESLPFRDQTFDAVIVAFGARNFERLEKGLEEMRRVVRTGGMAVILEFSIPTNIVLRSLYLIYFRTILPRIGRLISRHREAYTYLPNTVVQFPQGDDMVRIIRDAGFSGAIARTLTFGIATIYSGTRTQTSREGIRS